MIPVSDGMSFSTARFSRRMESSSDPAWIRTMEGTRLRCTRSRSGLSFRSVGPVGENEYNSDVTTIALGFS